MKPNPVWQPGPAESRTPPEPPTTGHGVVLVFDDGAATVKEWEGVPFEDWERVAWWCEWDDLRPPKKRKGKHE